MILVIAALSIGTPRGTTGISPVIHCLRVRPPLTVAVASAQDSPRFLRPTALRMNLPAVTRAAGAIGTSFTTCGFAAGALPKVSLAGLAVLPKYAIRNAITPATSSAAANHG